jgi:hypothetical protein
MIKPLVFLSLLSLCAPASGAILIAFHDFDAGTADETHDTAAAGFSATVAKGEADSRNAGGSDDSLYGNSLTLTAPTVTNGDGYLRLTNKMTMTVTYTGISPVQLSALYFDATYTTATTGLTVGYKINGGSLVSLNPAPFAADSNASGITTGSDTQTRPYDDFSRALSGVTLNTGDTIAFEFSSNSMRLDNIALEGSVIPEPSVVLSSLPAAALVLLRRRRTLF